MRKIYNQYHKFQTFYNPFLKYSHKRTKPTPSHTCRAITRWEKIP